ncbi:G-box-binding factor 4-like [Abrus precatorius]|uniref:G-box-binding factor 4-like n=1 Tax=Abrus precatorius TaxID=3816 RepID=A0A8B8MEJ3_ABRPR|nr:G-box-binding factor 4-like [Abrus precatorius]XP_027366273.1 G-box-binding factor 4-like [Abrus precatorius]
MASSKLMASSNSRKSETPSSPPPNPQFTTTNFMPMPDATATPKTVDEVWREIVAGERRECKEEAPDEMMTLEDFLVKARAVDDEDEDEVKMPMPLTERLSGGGGVFAFDPIPTTPFQGLESVEGSVIGFGNGVEVVEGGRGKRGRPVLEQLDKAAQQRQRRMIKNRESAARSRERKQAYQVELESLAVKLEEENDKLLKEKAERKKERYKQLMEKVIPIGEKRRPPRLLRRVRSCQW